MIQSNVAPARVLCDRYEIEALVGRGAMGEVFRARDLALGETVAVKVLRVEPRDIVAAAERFKQEVRLARRVTHRNVARVFDLVDGDLILLTMELVDGETLADVLLRDGALPLSRAVQIGTEICAGLGAVHAAGVVHRDLKPSNVMIEHETSRVVLTDFGVARNVRDATSTRLGTIVGTLRYMAPEQAEGRAVDARADIYSLGVVLREMGGRAGEENKRYQALVTRCLSAEPAERPPNVGNVAAELDAIIVPARSQLPSRDRRSIVVLPFRVASSATEPSLATVIADELTDVLSTVRELRVVASAAAVRLGDTREPAAVHAALAVDALIDGTVQVEGERVRITVRLVDAPGGNQVWREQYEGTLSQLLSLESTIAHRIAEHLRLRLTAHAQGDGVPPEAMRCYVQASALRMNPMMAAEYLALLDRAVALHPAFAPALASLALRSLTAWYVPFVDTPGDWQKTCEVRVQRALDAADSLAESHVASGYLHIERGSTREAELALRRALDLAPTCVEALTALGELECQTGRTASGTAHARLAVDLDPGGIMSAVTLAREDAYAGRLDVCLGRLDRLGDDAWAPPAYLLRVRAAGWHRAPTPLREWLKRGAGMSDARGRFPYGEVVVRAMLGESTREAQEGLFEGLLSIGKSPRFQAETRRIAVEMSVLTRRRDDALRHLGALESAPAFYDVAWLERCPALEPLRSEAVYAAVQRAAYRRAYATG